jgi:hypothetical protein
MGESGLLNLVFFFRPRNLFLATKVSSAIYKWDTYPAMENKALLGFSRDVASHGETTSPNCSSFAAKHQLLSGG